MLNIIINRGVKDIEDENYVFSPDTKQWQGNS